MQCNVLSVKLNKFMQMDCTMLACNGLLCYLKLHWVAQRDLSMDFPLLQFIYDAWKMEVPILQFIYDACKNPDVICWC